jgi:hypothetical protein
MAVSSWLRERFTHRARDSRPKAAALVAMLFQTAGTTVLVIAGIVGLVYVSFHASSLGPDDPPRSGIVVRTKVTAVWKPKAILDVARGEAGASVFCSPETVPAELKRCGLNDAWYALNYRSYQVNGGSAEITEIRRLSEAANHLDELQAVMARAAGRPQRFEGTIFSHAKVEVIPDTLHALDPREAITRLMAYPVVGEKSSPPGGLDSMRRTE